MELYSALQWADTAFPSGRYTLSHGLEGLSALAIVQKGDFATLHRVCAELILHSLAPVDLAAHFLTFETNSLADIRRIDQVVSAARATTSQRLGSIRVGKQMLFMASNLELHDALLDEFHLSVRRKEADGNQAVAAALIHRACGQKAHDAAVVEAFGFIASLASAAVRLQLTDYIEAQKLIAGLRHTVDEAVELAAHTRLEHVGVCTPLADIAAARHETAEARLFIT